MWRHFEARYLAGSSALKSKNHSSPVDVPISSDKSVSSSANQPIQHKDVEVEFGNLYGGGDDNTFNPISDKETELSAFVDKRKSQTRSDV